MRKFDESPAIGVEEPNAWENYHISGKWAPVVIESPYCITYKDTVEMIMRIDEMFDPYNPYQGNDQDWREFCRDYCNVPKEIPSWVKDKYPWGTETFDKLYEDYHEACDKFNEKWGRIGHVCDGTVFEIDLFASSYIGGPSSFVNFKTGRVGLIHNIGKWPETVGSCKEELEWIAKNWPNYKFFVTFCDDECYGHEQDTTTICTLMLYNGKITEVMPRKYEDWKYVYKINQLEGSTCAKRSYIPWKIRRFIPSPWRIKRFFMEKIAQKHFVNLWNEYVIDHNYSIRSMDGEKYFDAKHAMAVMDDWLSVLREREKNEKVHSNVPELEQ
jgi:hypothetical protein